MKSFREFKKTLHLFDTTHREEAIEEKKLGSKYLPQGERYLSTKGRPAYLPDSNKDERFKKGWKIVGNGQVYDKKGKELETLKKGQVVYITYPVDVLSGIPKPRSTSIGITWKGTGIKKKADGYINISSLGKPGSQLQTQARVSKGAESQKAVANYIETLANENGKTYEFVSNAGEHSGVPDLIVKYAGKKIQFEIKGSDNKNKNNLITLYDASMNRSKTHPEAEKLVPIFKKHLDIKGIDQDSPNVEITTMVDLVDLYRNNVNSAYGFPGDVGTVKSGRLPAEFKLTDSASLAEIRNLIIAHFAKGGDNYLVIHHRNIKNNPFAIFHTGHGPNPLNAPALPELEEFEFSTYGGVSSGKMRSGYKVKFNLKS